MKVIVELKVIVLRTIDLVRLRTETFAAVRDPRNHTNPHELAPFEPDLWFRGSVRWMGLASTLDDLALVAAQCW